MWLCREKCLYMVGKTPLVNGNGLKSFTIGFERLVKNHSSRAQGQTRTNQACFLFSAKSHFQKPRAGPNRALCICPALRSIDPSRSTAKVWTFPLQTKVWTFQPEKMLKLSSYCILLGVQTRNLASVAKQYLLVWVWIHTQLPPSQLLWMKMTQKWKVPLN